ncbi:5'-methylthioadenosine/S-adenosylhomocysteine nucleosidase [Thermus thermamylovorans]|uniref:adenosylhomocysteine nucleosidase n=1 Tax=Thermus thermamylovorans TaxID=2509362 RepID=A0A4Q9B5L3_9DEIN|nr:5'-methylthioadenosine/S-adenosylhomocysteine nucleosidase [Thermus thermamylovorans]TBH21339.1 5'-methylthioadenosine/S-adenosylhomocysteine nucleosidase [Thermus thermamylovorans]
MTAFFAAEPEEAEALKEALGAREALEAPFPLYRGAGVLVAETGVGKVAAASAVAHVLARFPPRESFFLGVAGALDPGLKALDLLLAEGAVQWDVDLTPFGRKPGETAFGLGLFPSDPHLLARAEGAARALGLPFRRGVVATGDRFLADGKEAERLRALFGAQAVEMEGAAALMVAWRYRHPMALVRAVTDGAGAGAAWDFQAFLREASRRLGLLARELSLY